MFNPLTDPPGYLTAFSECLAGAIFFPCVFITIQYILQNSWIGRQICRLYSLKNHGVYDISNKLTSSVFAILACYCGMYVYMNCGEDVLNERFYILENYLIFGVSYFFYDCVTMYMVYSTEEKEDVTVSSKEIIRFCKDRPLILLHHIFVPLVGFPALMFARGGQGDCLLGTSFLVEASTPFVSFRVILCHLGLKDSPVYIINGLIMLVTFFFCRVAIFPCLYVWYARLEGFTVLLSVPLWVHLAVAGLWFPQLLWFVKMVKGSIKLIRDANKKKSIKTN
ncbi:protein FAM57A [Eurytemora carolleeae]|uniref:protein FAM57A n=1 Tax=Eurytemora carolleeae TaxID=1294199 RepID=UPI000C76D512|nr:protein FAM57A [Eurytemora carolleeae]|eukprot:XP_023341058.1 protein FAM57A-like [Eurytemora affinis]